MTARRFCAAIFLGMLLFSGSVLADTLTFPLNLTSLFQTQQTFLITVSKPIGPATFDTANASLLLLTVTGPGDLPVSLSNFSAIATLDGNDLGVDFLLSSCTGFGTAVCPLGTLSSTFGPLTGGILSVAFQFDLAAQDTVSFNYFLDVENSQVPEPTSFLLLGSGVLGLVRATRRKLRQ